MSSLALAGSMTMCFGGSVIGLAIINGTARVDNADVRGNASIQNGSVVETSKGNSQLALQSGARLEMGAASRGTVYSDHVVLEKGMGQLHANNAYSVQANALRVTSVGSDSTVRVAIKDDKSILVSSVSGEARVTNKSGLLLAKLMPGSTYEFDQDAGAAAAVKVTGIVEKRGTNFFITDQTTNVMSQLVGADLSKYNKKKVTVTGSIDTSASPASPATQVVRVSSDKSAIMMVGAGAAGAAAGAATAGGIAGMTAGATAAVVGGVAVAGVVGGLAASGSFDNNSSK